MTASLLALAAAWFPAAGRASGHSLLLEAEPAAGAVLPTPPEVVSLRFNNRIEARLSSVRLVDQRGQARPVSRVEAPAPDRLRAVPPPLGPGTWRVEWRVLSTDGHVVSGAYSFRIAP